MRILIISCVRNWSEERIIATFNTRKWKYYLVYPREVSILMYNDEPTFILNDKIINPDICYIKRSKPELNYVYHIALACEKKRIPVIEKANHYSSPLSKMSSIIKRKGTVPVPNSAIFYSFESAKCFLNKAKYPLITKPLAGSMGEGIKLLRSFQEAINKAKKLFFVQSEDNAFFVQEFLNIKVEYRVLTIGKNIFAVCEKIKEPNMITANRAQGARFIRSSLSKDDTNLIKLAIDESELEISGIDFAITDKDERFILEINRNPNFKGVEEAYPELDVAEAIADHLLYLKQKNNQI